MSHEILDNFEIEEDRKPDGSELEKLQIVQGLAVLQIIAAIIATYLADYEIESIMGTGPIGSLIGIFVFKKAQKLSPIVGRFLFGKFVSFRKIGMILGLSAPIFSVFWFLTIRTLSLSTTAAHAPVSMALLIYTGILLLPIVFLFGAFKMNNTSPKE